MRKVCSPYKKIFKFFFFLIHAEGFISCEVNRTMVSEVLLLGLASLRLLSLSGGSLGLSLLLLFGRGSGGSLILLFVSREHFLLLLGLPVFPPLASLLDLRSAGVSLVSQHLGPRLLGLLLVDVLHEDTLVLESVTLGFQVQLVIQVAINLLSLPISLQQPPENTHPHDPHGLLGGSGILGTLALTETSVPSLPACFVVLANTGPGVDGNRLLDDKTILDELADVLARVGVSNLVDLVGVQPHLVLAALHDAGGKALLQPQGTPC